MRTVALMLILALMPALSLQAQGQIKIHIAPISGPDEFINQRIEMLLMEELSAIKGVEILSVKDSADLFVTGIGRLDIQRQATVAGGTSFIAGSAGDAPNALVSIKITDRSGRVVFVGNKSSTGGSKGATHKAVSELVKDFRERHLKN